ncbi:MAG TPA: alpha/beta fold hydrolase [Cyclobacteriaceae bacterium]
MKLTEKKIIVEGNEVSYFDEGKGITIVFIHGFPFDKSMWGQQLVLLRDQFRVIAYDVRGHGNTSANSNEFSIPQFTNDLLAFLNQLEIEKVIICGLSMGGYIALHAIESFPDKITGLILSDTQCAADTEEAKGKRMKTIELIRNNGLDQYASDSVKNLFAPSSLENQKDKVDFIKNTILKTVPDNICKALMALANRKEKCSILEKIKVPVLILVGEEDKVTPIAAATKMHELIKGSTLHSIKKAGHLSNLENPEEFNTYLKEFLTKF